MNVQLQPLQLRIVWSSWWITRLWISLLLLLPLLLLLIAMMSMTKILPWMNIDENDKKTTTVNLGVWMRKNNSYLNDKLSYSKLTCRMSFFKIVPLVRRFFISHIVSILTYDKWWMKKEKQCSWKNPIRIE